MNTHQLPAILIVNGSGPIDRDGNVPSMHMFFNTAKRFAEHISQRPSDMSIAVLSYDKRGVGKSSTDDKRLFYRTGMMDIVSDAVEAVRYIDQITHGLIPKESLFWAIQREPSSCR